MKVLFASKKYSPASWLIRAFTFSKFSHMAGVISSELVIDSTFLTGVRCITLEQFKEEYPEHVALEISLPNEQAAIDFAISQLGKPYDWSAIIGMIFQRKWHDDDSWFCNEFWEAAFIAGGRARFRDSVYRITPQQSWAVL